MSPGPEGRILIPKTSLRGFYETAKAGPFFATCCGTAEQAAEKLFLYRKAKNRSRQEALGAIRKGRLMV